MMRLFWSSRSPFDRKVVAAAHELGIADRIALDRVVVSGTAANEAVMAHNPLCQIHTLLRLQAIGDGIMENSVRRLGKRARGPLASALHAAANWAKIAFALDRLERDAPSLEAPNAGSVTIACAIAHLDFRHGDQEWRIARPAFADWRARFSARPSMQATAYRGARRDAPAARLADTLIRTAS